MRTLKDLEENITGRYAPVVEEIVDTRLMISYLRRSLIARRPVSSEICAFLSKPSSRGVDLDVGYVGFEVPDEFVVGCGVDFTGAYHNLPDICALKSEAVGR